MLADGENIIISPLSLNIRLGHTPGSPLPDGEIFYSKYNSKVIEFINIYVSIFMWRMLNGSM